MNKVNNLGQSVFVNCMNCNNYLKKSKYCNELLTHITTSSFAENCNSFDCDKILNEEIRKEFEEENCDNCLITKNKTQLGKCIGCGNTTFWK